jgi:hypothetical protein
VFERAFELEPDARVRFALDAPAVGEDLYEVEPATTGLHRIGMPQHVAKPVSAVDDLDAHAFAVDHCMEPDLVGMVGVSRVANAVGDQFADEEFEVVQDLRFDGVPPIPKGAAS